MAVGSRVNGTRGVIRRMPSNWDHPRHPRHTPASLTASPRRRSGSSRVLTSAGGHAPGGRRRRGRRGVGRLGADHGRHLGDDLVAGGAAQRPAPPAPVAGELADDGVPSPRHGAAELTLNLTHQRVERRRRRLATRSGESNRGHWPQSSANRQTGLDSKRKCI